MNFLNLEISKKICSIHLYRTARPCFCQLQAKKATKRLLSLPARSTRQWCRERWVLTIHIDQGERVHKYIRQHRWPKGWVRTTYVLRITVTHEIRTLLWNYVGSERYNDACVYYVVTVLKIFDKWKICKKIALYFKNALESWLIMLKVVF